ncbi:sulfurtransferase [bacterium]|nr:sulfurtransferase [bacterium]
MKSQLTFRIILGFFLLAFVVGCSSEQPVASVPASQPNPQFLVSATALMQTSVDPNTIIVHVSATDEKFSEGHLPSARFLDLDWIAINAENVQRDLPAPDSLIAAFQRIGVNNESRVILYDDSNGMSATRAFFALDYLGFSNMAVLDGGLASWTAAGGTISSNVSPTYASGNLAANLNEGRVMTASAVNDAREHSVLIDARSEGEFSGTDPGNTITRGGHIPGAVHLDWSSHLKEDGTLKSMEELKALYHVAEGQHTIVYCRTGMKASHSYFVARLIGLDVSLYDGSFYDWSNMTDYPVETGL